MARAPRPWGDYAMRLLACALLAGSGVALLSGSTFAVRMRDDVPVLVPGATGVQGLALLLSAALGFLPLAFGRRFLAAFLVSAFLLSGIGAYWWTTIPWDELVTESDFVAQARPDAWRYGLVASPAVAAVLYVGASRASRLRAEYARRGADRGEVTRAACASFVAGMGALAATCLLAGALWWMLSQDLLQRAPDALPRGAPAVALAAALLAAAYLIGSGRLRSPSARGVRRPSRGAPGPGAPGRSRGRRSPS